MKKSCKISKIRKYFPVLIDTHVMLWVAAGMTGRLGKNSQHLVLQALSEYYVSVVSFFEVSIKQRKGGLKEFDMETMEIQLTGGGARLLPVHTDHFQFLPTTTQTNHKDPFDLLLIGQAVAERLPFLTCDAKILAMDIPGLRLIDGRK